MIAIVDYGMGNLRSVQKGFAKVGFDAEITDDPARLAAADKIVLPGVGAFGDAMQELRRRELVQPLVEAAAADKPLLGICLGLQLLFDVGFEGGRHEGLGILAGEVVPFLLSGRLKVPHMGWNQLQIQRPSPMLHGLDEGAYVYFVHSFYVAPRDEQVIATQTDYGGPFTSSIARGRLFATQFHPEKSQADGLKILANFGAL